MRQPKLIAIGGSLATGKTTLAKNLCESTGVHRISMDELKEHMFDYAGYKDRAWSRRIGQITWPLFQSLVDLHLSYEQDVIAEATFLWPSDADWLNEMKEKHSADLRLLWLTSDPNIARQRILDRASKERHPGHNDALEHVIEEFDQKYFNRTFVPVPIDGPSTIVDTTQNFPKLNDVVSFFDL